MKAKEKVVFNVQGQRVSLCRQCHPGKDVPMYERHNPVRAVYIRKPNVGFKRIGWYFEWCGHVEIDVVL